MKNLLLVIALVGGVSFHAACQTLTNSIPNTGCRTSASGTLTVSNYNKVVHWEEGEMIGSNFYPVFTHKITAASYSYSTSASTTSFRAKLNSTTYSNVISIVSYYPPVPGTLSGGSTHLETGSGTLTVSGYSGQIVKWQSSLDNGGTWTDITHTGSSYNYNNLTQTARFRVVVGNGICPVVYSNSATISIKKKGILAGPALVSDEAIATLTLQNYNASIVGWEYSTDGGTTWISDDCKTATFNHPVSKPTRFRVLLDLNPFGQQYSPVHDVSLNTITYSAANPVTGVAGQNYIKEQTVAVKGITASEQVDALSVAEKHETIAYGNGFNEPIQQVARQASPLQHDLVNFSVYDQYGRSSKTYLPYVASTSDGSYQGTFVEDQAAFYTNGAEDKIEDSAYPFAETKFENSPLARPVEHGSVGEAWQPGNGHTIRNSYKSNIANEVRLFQPDGSSTGFYPANELSKIEVTDADNRKRESFIDKFGKTILQRVQLDENISGVQVSWLETYYIYNTDGSVRFIVSPKGVAALQEGGWFFTQAIKDQYVYQFTYDAIGRMVEKKVPGQAPLYYCYDRLNRVVLIQDAHTRSQHQWFYIKYDRKGRPVMQGLYTNTVDTTRTSMQDNVINPLYAMPAAAYYEERGTAQHGYTNQSFPVANAEVLTVNYYDTYDFDYNGSPDFVYTPQSLMDENTPASTTIGMPTGSKRMVLESNQWLYNYIYYDRQNRVIQVRSNNHLSAAIDNLMTVVYDFEGKKMLQKNYHNAGNNRITTVVNQYTYDHAGRLVEIKQNNNNALADQVVAHYTFNELGKVVDKKLHYTGSDFLQSIDLRYNIQGWLTSINNAALTNDGVKNDDATDYFGMEYLYHVTEPGLTTTSDARYSGNISALKWKGIGAAPGAADQRSYTFAYDKANRLKSALSKMNTGSGWTKEQGVMDENMTYDNNGNILALQRTQRMHALDGVVPSYTSEVMDDLAYTYNPDMGDQLVKVTDAALPEGFNNGSSGADNDYTYDTHGNLLRDANKGISEIVYNIFGKPARIHFSDGRKIEYGYDAAGSKLTVKNFAGGSSTPQHVTDYVDGFVYENGALSFFASPEGRVAKKGSDLEYQYAIADHQGNTRVVFSSVNPTSAPAIATFEDAVSDAQVFRNVNTSSMYWVSKPPANNTASGQYVIRMNNSYKTGPAKSLKVFPGDVVELEVWAYYEGMSGFGASSQPLNTLIESVASALTAGLPAGEGAMITSGVSTAYTTFGAPGNLGDDRPTAFLNYILLDKDYNILDMGWQPVPSSANMARQKVSFAPKAIKEAGYMYVYLSYEGDGTNWVYFDDLKITHTQTRVIQYNEYYPFGLQAGTSWTRDGNENKFLYNEGSELNITSGFYDLFYRNYDPALGRFAQVDPQASLYRSLSPYHYSGNNPVMFNDPNGDRYMYIEMPRYSEGYLRVMGYASGGGSIMAGSGNNWSDQFRSVEGNAALMSPETFNEFYGITDEYGNVNENRRNEVARQVGTTAYWVTTDEGNFIYADKSFQDLKGWYRAQAFTAQQGGPDPTDPPGRGSATSFSFGFAFVFGISGEWGVVTDETGASKPYYTVSANFGLGLDIGFNKKEIIPTNGNRFRVEQYEGRGKNMSYGVMFTSEARGGNTPDNPTLSPTDFGGLYKERTNTLSPFLGLPVSFGLGDVGVIYQMSKTSFFKP